MLRLSKSLWNKAESSSAANAALLASRRDPPPEPPVVKKKNCSDNCVVLRENRIGWKAPLHFVSCKEEVKSLR